MAIMEYTAICRDPLLAGIPVMTSDITKVTSDSITHLPPMMCEACSNKGPSSGR